MTGRPVAIRRTRRDSAAAARLQFNNTIQTVGAAAEGSASRRKRLAIMKLAKRITKQRVRRAYRVRNRARSAGRVRLSVFRSNKHIYAQIIDDDAGRTLVSASTLEKALGGGGRSGGTRADAERVGAAIGERAVAAGISEVAFDRGAYKYHGRVAALADAARKAGLQF